MGWGNGWIKHGGGIKGEPAVYSRQPTITDVFARGLDDGLWQNSWVQGAGWSGWFPHNDGFVLGSSPVADSMGPDHVHLFACDPKGAVYQKWWIAGSDWSGWEPREGGVLIGAPAVVSRSSNVCEVFGRGLNNGLWQDTWTSDSGWSGWFPHNDGFLLGSSPAVDSMGPDHVHVFACDPNGAVFQKWWTNGNDWSNWDPREGGILKGAPTVRSRSASVCDVFGRGLDNRLWQDTWTAAGWSGWFPHDAAQEPFSFLKLDLGSAPVADSMGPDFIHVFARGQDGALWQRWWQASASFTVKLHLKLIIKPKRFEEMLHGIRQALAPVWFEFSSVEVLDWKADEFSEFVDVSVIEKCPRDTISTEQDRLFIHRNNVGTNELVIYFVNTTFPVYNGCASHPTGKPGAIVVREASAWTLAHEVGHVLGLSHCDNKDKRDFNRLMTGGGTGLITNPPPDVTTGEWNSILSSPLVFR